MLEVVKSARPTWVLCENVPGVIKMALPTIVADLEAAGYESVVLLVPAIGVGAPHRRRRAWIVGKSLHTDADGVRPYRAEMHQEGQGGGPELQNEQERLPRPMVPEQIWASIDPGVLGVDDGVPDRLDRANRLRGLGNAVVPYVAYEILRSIREVMVESCIPGRPTT
jgi:DNA (cytosine-5)-methyltransferase 1